jgi:CRISPR/Cas system CMR-associated protein Cmr1 (group 7 of RAMP superfamily)
MQSVHAENVFHCKMKTVFRKIFNDAKDFQCCYELKIFQTTGFCPIRDAFCYSA